MPPYKFANCTTASLSDNRTAEHSAPSLPRWEAITQKYHAMGEQASYLKASMGPVRSVGDGVGRYVDFQGGVIVWTAKYRAVALTTFVRQVWGANGGPQGGRLGYPTAARVATPDNGWLQTFERGAITDSASTSTQVVWGYRWTIWQASGRERGILGYPTGPYTASAQSGWFQLFQKGAIVDSPVTTTRVVSGPIYSAWSLLSRERGPLGYPTGPQQTLSDGWIQLFQNGAITGGPVTTEAVPAPMYTPWVNAGREAGVLGYPTGPSHTEPRGLAQFFQRGELWALGSTTPRRVHGAVLTAWKSEGGATGRYGYPVADTTDAGGGRLTCTFEGGTITA